MTLVLKKTDIYGGNRRDVLNFLKPRLASPTEDASLGDLLIRSFVDTYAKKLPEIVTNEDRLSELRDIASRRKIGAVYVIELGKKIVGTFSLVFPYAPGTQAWISGAANLRCLAVDPDYHGYGFSQVLLEASEVIASSWGVQAICLHVQKGAEGVSKLYERFGYKRAPEGDMNSTGNQIEGYVLWLNPTATPAH